MGLGVSSWVSISHHESGAGWKQIRGPRTPYVVHSGVPWTYFEGCAVISFTVDGVQFNLRAAAVIIDNGYVLLHRATHEDFWSLPGGRVEVGEPSAAAIARELAEELRPACDARLGRLLWMVENFFTYEGAQFHKLGMYYHVTLGTASPYLAKERAFDGIEDNLPLHEGEHIRLIFQWFPLDALADTTLYPMVLRARLHVLPAATELLVETDAGMEAAGDITAQQHAEVSHSRGYSWQSAGT